MALLLLLKNEEVYNFTPLAFWKIHLLLGSSVFLVPEPEK